MYSNNVDIDTVIEAAAKFVTDNDRALHTIFFNRIEELSAELGIVIGGRAGLLLLAGERPDHTLSIWDLYFEDTFNTARRITIELSKLHSPHIDTRTIALGTNIKHRELTIFINAQKIFNIHGLKKGRAKIMSTMCRGFNTGNQVLAMVPIYQLDELYRTFYSPAADWDVYKYEAAVFDTLITTPLPNLPQSQKIYSIPSLPSKLSIPKLLIGQCVHVGNFAASKYVATTDGRLQILTSLDIPTVKNAIAECYNIARNGLIVNKYDLDISDFRLTKHTIYERKDGKLHGLCDVFNSPEYEIIPYDTLGAHRVANIFTIMRFLAIDIFVASIIGANSQYKMQLLTAVREYAMANIEAAFTFTNYIGILSSDTTAKKKIIRAARDTDGFLPLYYPAMHVQIVEKTELNEHNEFSGQEIITKMDTDISTIIGGNCYGAKMILLDDLAPKVPIMKKFFRNCNIDSVISNLEAYKKTPTQTQWGSGKKVNYRRYQNFVPFIPKNIDTYIDIGCGSGLDAIALDHNFLIRRVILADIEDTRDSLAHGMEFIKIKINTPIDLPDASVDLVSVFHSIHHMLGDLQCRLDDIARICRPGAIVLVKDHDVNSYSDAADVDFEHFIYLLPEQPGNIYELAVKFPELCPMEYYSANEIKMEFVSRGFNQLYCEITNPTTHVYCAVFKKI